MPVVFSYGSLREVNVQLATFGRLLRGSTDALPGYAMRWLPEGDPRLARVAGRTQIADVVRVSDAAGHVPGTAFELTEDELAAADAFEAEDSYRRIAVRLASGRDAWVFVDATLERARS